jgi:hypothetical protein
MTQRETITATELSGSGICSISRLRNSTCSSPRLRRRLGRSRAAVTAPATIYFEVKLMYTGPTRHLECPTLTTPGTAHPVHAAPACQWTNRCVA